MNFHWGYRAAVLYLGFVIFMLTLVFVSTQQDYELVTKDYYEQDLAYQGHIESANNAKEMSKPIEFKYDGENKLVELLFPNDMLDVQGNIHFYKPDKANLDFDVPLALNQSQEQIIDFSKQNSGLWRVKLNWNFEGQSYFVENLFVKQ